MNPGQPCHLEWVVRALNTSRKCSPEVFCQRHPDFALRARALHEHIDFYRTHGSIKTDGRLDPASRPTVIHPALLAQALLRAAAKVDGPCARDFSAFEEIEFIVEINRGIAMGGDEFQDCSGWR